MSLPKEAKERKTYPIFSGVLMYFPDAIAEVANVSFVGNEQHHPGSPLHWDRSKSTDEEDALMRHLVQRGTRDSDGVRHSAKVAWRALAMLQKEIERDTLAEFPPIVKELGPGKVIELGPGDIVTAVDDEGNATVKRHTR